MTDAPPRVAVIGAGIIGSAVARQLALHGAEVWLLDRKDRAEGTTGISFAWLNAHRRREPNYHHLNVAGMAEHHVLAHQLERHRLWHFPTGHLEYATEPDHAARIEQDVRELRELDYPAQWVDREWAKHANRACASPRVSKRWPFSPAKDSCFPACSMTLSSITRERLALTSH